MRQAYPLSRVRAPPGLLSDRLLGEIITHNLAASASDIKLAIVYCELVDTRREADAKTKGSADGRRGAGGGDAELRAGGPPVRGPDYRPLPRLAGRGRAKAGLLFAGRSIHRRAQKHLPDRRRAA